MLQYFPDIQTKGYMFRVKDNSKPTDFLEFFLTDAVYLLMMNKIQQYSEQCITANYDKSEDLHTGS